MSYQVIARKYRPQVFDEVIGQPLITGTLKNAIQHDRVAHGYIFSGARGVGKTTTARILAKALNCAQGPTATPDGTCPSCVEIAAGNSVDVLEIDAASNRGIDEIRELRETVRYLPARDRYKVFIIDEVHMLTTEAFNALLKTLEEPPPRSLFILATTEPHKLPSTIQSRCQHFAFRLLDYAEVYTQLERICASEKVQTNEKALSAIAQAAEGSLRDALSILDQVIAACGDRLDENRVRQLLGVVPASFMNRLAEAIRAGDARQALESVSQLAAEGYELGHFCGEFTRYLRDLMVARSCGAQSPLLQVPQDERSALEELARQFSEEDLSRFFQIMLHTEAELRYSLQPRFHLELGLMKLVHARRLASLEGLLGELRTAGPAASGPPRTGSSSAGPGSARLSSVAEPLQSTPAKRQEIAAAVGSLVTPRVPAVTPAPPSQAARLSSAAAERGALGASSTAAIPPAHPRDAKPDDERLAAIKTLIFGQSKLLGSCLEPLVGWRFENGEVRFTYAKKDSWAADLLKSRERQETLRAACTQVLGEAVKVCVTLVESEEPVVGAAAGAKERAGRHPVVEALRKYFDCVVVKVEDLSQG